MAEVYKFQKLQVYQLALAYVDSVYAMSRQLPERERFNLCSQIERVATSIALNIAEGSTGQTDPEQNRFLGLALRSYLETIACCDLQGTAEIFEPNFPCFLADSVQIFM